VEATEKTITMKLTIPAITLPAITIPLIAANITKQLNTLCN